MAWPFRDFNEFLYGVSDPYELAEARRKKEEEQAAIVGMLPEAAKSALDTAGNKLWEGAKWLVDSSPLKPIADKLRDPETREQAREYVPFFREAETVAGIPSAMGAWTGATLDRTPDEAAALPDIGSIMKREYEEGLPTAMEQVAPIDLATVGTGFAARGALAAGPRAARAVRPLLRGANALDAVEAGVGVGQVGEGVIQGDPQKAAMGAVRAGLGSAGFLSGPSLPDVPDFNRLPDDVTTATSVVEDFGGSPNDVLSRSADPPRDIPSRPGEVPVQSGVHGVQRAVQPPEPAAEPPSVDRLIEMAREDSARNPVEPASNQGEIDARHEEMLRDPSLEMPPPGKRPTPLQPASPGLRANDFVMARAQKAVDEIKPALSRILGEDASGITVRRGFQTEYDPDTHTIYLNPEQILGHGPDVGQAIKYVLSHEIGHERGVHEFGAEGTSQTGDPDQPVTYFNRTGPPDPDRIDVEWPVDEVGLPTPDREFDMMSKSQEYQRAEAPLDIGFHNESNLSGRAGMGQPEESAFYGAMKALQHDPEVIAVLDRMAGDINTSKETKFLRDKRAQNFGIYDGKFNPDPIKEDIDLGPVEMLLRGEEYTPPKKPTGDELYPPPEPDPLFPEVTTPEAKPAMEGTPPPAKMKSFAEFMKEKFGDKSTTARERATARAEYNRLKEENKIRREAEAAGIPPEKVEELLKGEPKTPEETGVLSRWRRAAYPVIDNFDKVHGWLGDAFRKYVSDAEKPAMINVAEGTKIRGTLSSKEQKMVVDLLDGKVADPSTLPQNVVTAGIKYRQMLDAAWDAAVAAGVRSPKDMKRSSYFPHKFAEGWDDNLVQNLYMDKNWNLRESNLEKARLSKRTDYRRDLDVLDEYFLSAYRRISEVQNFGKRLDLLRRFAKKHVTNKETAEWLQTNIRRVMGREHPTLFDRVSGHARHVQALSDLGLAAFYQPIQTVNTALYGGLGRSVRALARIVKDSPSEVYDAIRSGALTPTITQEIIQGAYGAREGIKNSSLQKFMWGIPTIDKWTRVHANTVGKMILEDALKGGKGAARDLKTLGFDTKASPEDVGKALSDKALFRSGSLEVPGWASSTAGKLGTQYMRFMYRHSLFVKDIFSQAGKGNYQPLARLLTVAPVAITGMAEVLYPIREGLREAIREGVMGEDIDEERIKGEAMGSEDTWDEETEWKHVLRNKRIPWSHPLKRALQNVALWGGVGIFQIMMERMMGGEGSIVDTGAKALGGPVPTNAIELVGSGIKDLNRLPEDLEYENPPGKYLRRWGVRQVPIMGYPLSRRMSEELEE